MKNTKFIVRTTGSPFEQDSISKYFKQTVFENRKKESIN